MIRQLDLALFEGIQNWLGGGSFAFRMVYVGSLYFWMPFFAFLAVAVFQASPRRGAWNIFFGLACFVLAYQAATLISVLVGHPAPYVFAALEGVRMPAFQEVVYFSLPDWAPASLVATMTFALRRCRGYGLSLSRFLWLIPAFFVLARILPGYAYPLDALTGVLIGAGMGYLVDKLAQNFGVVMGWTEEESREEIT